jgi:hypothetical protein
MGVQYVFQVIRISSTGKTKGGGIYRDGVNATAMQVCLASRNFTSLQRKIFGSIGL